MSSSGLSPASMPECFMNHDAGVGVDMASCNLRLLQERVCSVENENPILQFALQPSLFTAWYTTRQLESTLRTIV